MSHCRYLQSFAIYFKRNSCACSIRSDRLIANSANADEVFDAAETDSANQPLVGFVDDPDKIYAGF
jgi:hypothetical protein